jgi:predicted nucleic acid-binding protein
VLEKNPRYWELALATLRWTEEIGHTAVTSTVTVTELFAKPLRALDTRRIAQMQNLLTDFPNLTWVPVDLELANQAARIRAAYNLKTPDALQAATAFLSGATAFITNDAIFERIQQFETLMLDRLL